MKTHKLVLTCLMVLSSVTLFAQVPIQRIINKVPSEPIPFVLRKTTGFLNGYNYSIANPEGKIPEWLYDDVQGKLSYKAYYPDQGIELFRKFNIPNSTNKLVCFFIGGLTDWTTMVLCVVSPSGEILSSLEAMVSSSRYMDVKQFRIDSQMNIVVAQLVPTSTAPVLFANFTEFTANRVDKTYRITPQGQFVQTSETRYSPRVYTRKELETVSKNLWDGNEIPVL